MWKRDNDRNSGRLLLCVMVDSVIILLSRVCVPGGGGGRGKESNCINEKMVRGMNRRAALDCQN